MSTVHSSTSHQAPSLSVELLGKPIHIVKNKLEQECLHASHTLRQALQSWLNSSSVNVNVETLTLTEEPPAATNLISYSVLQHNSGGRLSVNLTDSLLVRLADHFYGASIERTTQILTASDLRLQERIAQLISTWVAPTEQWQTTETPPHNGMGIIATLRIRYPHPTHHDAEAVLMIHVDSVLIQTLIDELALTPSPHIASDFQYALQSTPVRLNVQLSKTELPLTQVLNLQPNDILPIDLLTSAPVHIGKERLFTGRVAEQDGQLVLILNNDKESNQ
ncbi:hypothetical protein BCU70_15845 [Vibrio sp. 10N.286.49.C2]|uniref:FliM/FliN family flagellar motor switch protein n=1 Tax=unclassified Vibrio TaxID=2614977 RepID=UPI000C82A1DD|nr:MULTISPECIES: FliM/FliN family flagellar motor C-terminal domain-containing protein [unclassified Vibrio]PMH37370.1 hypothetical protein BCU70_15845 [Vibrio sp. 10N.286.49.C2]PMH49458.1 hypothetical protein BCU66_20510 [Vibrio sp. 10N.286.49.B1]PMH83857.1 hypothetical protein BCU58_13065 [Vibrio sp. 10N.286.48.B7]